MVLLKHEWQSEHIDGSKGGWRVYQKRSHFARLPHLQKLTPSKTKQFCKISLIFELQCSTTQFCETSSSFDLGNVKSEETLRDLHNFTS